MSSDLESRIRAVRRAKSERFLDLVAVAKLHPGRSFRHIDLRGVSFAGQDLAGFDMTGANLVGCNFVGARLAGAIFTGALVDENGAAAIALAETLAAASRADASTIPEIVAELVQDTEDFTESALALTALKSAAYVPNSCFNHVLHLAPSETAALQVFDSWNEFPGCSDHFVLEKLCSRMRSPEGAEAALDRALADANRWQAQPYEYVKHFPTEGAKLAALSLLGEHDLLTNEAMSHLAHDVFPIMESSALFELLKKLVAAGRIQSGFVALIQAQANYATAREVAARLVAWKAPISKSEMSMALMIRAESADQALDALSLTGDGNLMVVLHAIRQLSISQGREFLLALKKVPMPAVVIAEMLLRPLAVADLILLAALSTELSIPPAREISRRVRRDRPVLAHAVSIDALEEVFSDAIWDGFEQACVSVEEVAAFAILRAAVRQGRSSTVSFVPIDS